MLILRYFCFLFAFRFSDFFSSSFTDQIDARRRCFFSILSFPSSYSNRRQTNTNEQNSNPSRSIILVREKKTTEKKCRNVSKPIQKPVTQSKWSHKIGKYFRSFRFSKKVSTLRLT